MLITGGRCREENIAVDQVFLLNLSKNEYVEMPSLKSCRSHHSSCCTEAAAFVIGGYHGPIFNGQGIYNVNTFEMLPFNEQRDLHGNVKPSEWSEITISNLTPEAHTLMALFSTSSILIMGGGFYGALIFDTEILQVTGYFGLGN